MELGRDRLIADRLTGFERDQRRPACPLGEVGGNLSDLTDNGRRCLRRCQEWIMNWCATPRGVVLHQEACMGGGAGDFQVNMIIWKVSG